MGRSKEFIAVYNASSKSWIVFKCWIIVLEEPTFDILKLFFKEGGGGASVLVFNYGLHVFNLDTFPFVCQVYGTARKNTILCWMLL